LFNDDLANTDTILSIGLVQSLQQIIE